MRVIRTILAGEAGSMRFLNQWGDALYAVRYRDDEMRGKVLTTVEIVVDERPKIRKNQHQRGYLSARNRSKVLIPIDYHEDELREKVKQAGAQWCNASKAWIMTYHLAVSLGLKHRIRIT